MARYTGAVRFGDGTTMYFVYNATVDAARRRLYLTEEAATAAWAVKPELADCEFERPTDEEIVGVMPYFATGDHEVKFMSRASKSLRLITGPRDFLSSVEEQDQERPGDRLPASWTSSVITARR